MKKYNVSFSPLAIDQLTKLGEYISDKAGDKIAANYIAAIKEKCASLKIAPLRGRCRDDLFLGLRIMGFRKRVNIVFSVYKNSVVVQGVFGSGQDIDSILIETDIREEF